jgi:hypothetical protein
VEFLLDQFVAVLLVARIEGLAAMRQPVQGRDGEIEMAVLDQLRHLPVEEGNQQRSDMRAVDISVGHHDDLVVAQVGLAIMAAIAAAQRLN